MDPPSLACTCKPGPCHPALAHPPHAPARGEHVGRGNQHSGAVGRGAKHAGHVRQQLLIGSCVGGALCCIFWQVDKAGGQGRLLASRALALWEATLSAAVSGGVEGWELMRGGGRAGGEQRVFVWGATNRAGCGESHACSWLEMSWLNVTHRQRCPSGYIALTSRLDASKAGAGAKAGAPASSRSMEGLAPAAAASMAALVAAAALPLPLEPVKPLPEPPPVKLLLLPEPELSPLIDGEEEMDGDEEKEGEEAAFEGENAAGDSWSRLGEREGDSGARSGLREGDSGARSGLREGDSGASSGEREGDSGASSGDREGERRSGDGEGSGERTGLASG